MRVVITGVPGTGKTAIAEIVARLAGLRLVKVNDVVGRKSLWTGKDRFGTRVVKMTALATEMRRLMQKDGVVVEGHLACEFGLPADYVVVMRTEPDVLERRFISRDYPPEKKDENLMAEMLDYCTICALEHYRPESVYELDTTRTRAAEAAKSVMFILKGKGKKFAAGKVNWSKQLEKKLVG